MKLSEHIGMLQHLLEQSGDLDLIYSRDDEGNGYHPVNYLPSIMYVESDFRNYSDAYSEDDFEERGLTDSYQKVVCIN
jgi:hypothetical protein